MLQPPLDHPFWLFIAFVLGACIGSFLNVVIYRVPLGMSVNEPKRSFCPKCRADIPMRLNIPLVSWLALRGKCAACGVRIPMRYFWVELVTGLLFAAVAWLVFGRAGVDRFSPELLAVFPLWYLAAVCVAITFIDAEHLVIPLVLTISGTVAGVVAAMLMPELTTLAPWGPVAETWRDGLVQAALGGVIGFFGLWAVVLLGKMAFGKFELAHEEAVGWRLIEPTDDESPIIFEMGGERIEWWDIFYRKSDRLRIDAEKLTVNGEVRDGGTVVIAEDGVELPGGERVALEDLKSLEGTATRAVVPREAMGMGDAHLMGMVGVFFGWVGVFFSLMAGSMLAIVAALLGRIGFGKRLPFGPFLVLGALGWLFGGWRLAEWYFAMLR